jgi:hypothetical protein
VVVAGKTKIQNLYLWKAPRCASAAGFFFFSISRAFPTKRPASADRTTLEVRAR